MAINVADNFSYKGSKPLDARTKFSTVAGMVATPVADLYDGCEAYVTATKKYYCYDSTNDVDETLGKWRERPSGGGSGTSDYTDLSNKPQIEGVTLNGNKSASDLGLVTKAVNDLVNYWLKTETYSKTEVDTIVTAIKNSRFEVVATLPTTDIKTNVIYLVPSADPQTSNVKDEYINLDGTTSGWEKIGTTSIDLSGYVTETELNTALADYTTTTDLTTLLNGKQDVFRKYSLPTATEELVGTMYQYMGATNANYTHGYWYECVVGTEPNTYKWQQTNQQPSSGGGGGGHTIEDAEGTDLTQRDTMQFGTGFNATDDSENEKTVVEADVMQSGDMDDIVTPLPSVAPKKEGIKYSTTEQVIGEWIDGKPLYQKTIVGEVTNRNSGVNPVLFYEFGTDVIIQNINGRLDTNVFSLLIPYAQDSLTSKMAIFFNTANTGSIKNGSICYFSGLPNSLTSVSLLLNVQYTKTTDTATT